MSLDVGNSKNQGPRLITPQLIERNSTQWVLEEMLTKAVGDSLLLASRCELQNCRTILPINRMLDSLVLLSLQQRYSIGGKKTSCPNFE
ncbi:hypothetical protein D9M71_655010 [compost metagenome]